LAGGARKIRSMDDPKGVYCSALCKHHCSNYSSAYSSRGLRECNQTYTDSTGGCIDPGTQCGTVEQPEILPKHFRHSMRVKKSRAKRAPNTAICSLYFPFRRANVLSLLASQINSPHFIEFLLGSRSLRAHERQDASAGRTAIRLPRPASHQNARAARAESRRGYCMAKRL
jgi:hypothetical protein